LGEKEYARIKIAEDFGHEGNNAFAALKNEYYELKGWQSKSA